MTEAARQYQVPAVPVDVLRSRGRLWGRAKFPEDRVLETPRLIATRFDEAGRCQALYQTVENPDTGGRGFIVDEDYRFGGERPRRDHGAFHRMALGASQR
jgi:hypothetical protein